MMCLVLLVPYVSNVASAADPATPSPSISGQGMIGKQTFEALDTTKAVEFTFTANYPGSNAPTVTWKSNDETIVKIENPNTNPEGAPVMDEPLNPSVVKSQQYKSYAVV